MKIYVFVSLLSTLCVIEVICKGSLPIYHKSGLIPVSTSIPIIVCQRILSKMNMFDKDIEELKTALNRD